MIMAINPNGPGADRLQPAAERRDFSATGVTSRREKLIGICCAVGVVLLFSSFVLVSRYGLRTELEPADLAFVRFVVAGLIVLPIFWRNGTAGLRLPQAIALATLGAIGFVLLAYHGFDRAPASHGSALLHGTLPGFSLLFAYLFAGQSPGNLSLAGAVTIASGVVLIIWDSLAVADGSQLGGDFLLLCAAASWAGYGLLVGRLALPALTAAALITTLAAACYLPIYLVARSSHLLTLPLKELIVQALFQGTLVGTVSVILYTRVVQALGPNAAALSAAFVPALTTVLAIPMLGETPSVAAILGVLLVTLGILVPIILRRRLW